MNKLIILSVVLLSLNSWSSLKLATYNIRNFDYDVRYDIRTNKSALTKIIKDVDADIMAIQEIVEDRVFIQYIDRWFPQYKVILSECGGQNDQKLGFIYKKSRFVVRDVKEDLSLSTSRPGQDPECYRGSRPAMFVNFYDKYERTSFTAIAVHLKSGGEASSIQKRFYQIDKISSKVKTLKNKGHSNIIIMGDFNTTEYIQKRNEYKKFLNIFDSISMDDLSKRISCSSYWFGGVRDDREYPTILDHIVVSGFLSKKVRKVEVGSHCAKLRCSVTHEDSLGTSWEEVSDHCPVTAEFY